MIFENYNSCKQKYGKIWNWKDWHKYVAKYYSIDINNFTYDTFKKYIKHGKLKHCIPNVVILTDNAALGRLDTVKDVRKIPVETDWCIKARAKFNSIINQGDELYAIYLSNQTFPYIFTIALIQNGEIAFFDSNNQRQYETIDTHRGFLNQIPNEIMVYLNKRAVLQKEKTDLNCSKCKKQIVILTEARLKQMIEKIVINYFANSIEC